MRSFWNDSDGLSITDTIALIVVVPYIIMNLLPVIFPQYLESSKIMLTYLEQPLLIVLASYFGGTVLSSAITTYYSNKDDIKSNYKP